MFFEILFSSLVGFEFFMFARTPVAFALFFCVEKIVSVVDGPFGLSFHLVPCEGGGVPVTLVAFGLSSRLVPCEGGGVQGTLVACVEVIFLAEPVTFVYEGFFAPVVNLSLDSVTRDDRGFPVDVTGLVFPLLIRSSLQTSSDEFPRQNWKR